MMTSTTLLSAAVVRSGKTQAEIARTFKVSHVYIHHIVNGKRPIPLHIAAGIKSVLRMEDADYLRFVRAYAKEKHGLEELIEGIGGWPAPERPTKSTDEQEDQVQHEAPAKAGDAHQALQVGFQGGEDDLLGDYRGDQEAGIED